MIPLRSLALGAASAFVAAAAILFGHELLARHLVGELARLDVPAAAGAATLLASLVVHLATGIFVLPNALRLRRAGVPVGLVRTAAYVALVVVCARAATEAGTGVMLVGLPLGSIAAVAAGLAALHARPERRRSALRRMLSLAARDRATAGGVVVARPQREAS